MEAKSADGFERKELTAEHLQIIDELIAEDDHVNAYIETWLNTSEHFGIDTEDTSETVNLYADYYPEDGRLSVYYIHRGSHGEVISQTTLDDLTKVESGLILRLMKDERMDELIAEMNEKPQTGMSMQ